MFLQTAPAAATSGGILITVLNDPALPQFYTDENGNVLLDNLPPGIHHLMIQLDGYARVVLHRVVVSGGETTSLSDQLLTQFRLMFLIILRN